MPQLEHWDGRSRSDWKSAKIFNSSSTGYWHQPALRQYQTSFRIIPVNDESSSSPLLSMLSLSSLSSSTRITLFVLFVQNHLHHLFLTHSSLFWECSPELIRDKSFLSKSMKLFSLQSHLRDYFYWNKILFQTFINLVLMKQLLTIFFLCFNSVLIQNHHHHHLLLCGSALHYWSRIKVLSLKV